MQDSPLPVVERAEAGRKQKQVVARCEGIVGDDRAVELACHVLRRGKRDDRACPLRRDRFRGLALLDTRLARDLRERRRSRQLGREAGAVWSHPPAQVRQASRDADARRAVAQVPLDLARDGRGGEALKLASALRVEAVDGLDEPDAADLDEVLEALTAVRVAARERTDEGQLELDQSLPRTQVARLGVRPQQPSHLPVVPSVHGTRPRPTARSRCNTSPCISHYKRILQVHGTFTPALGISFHEWFGTRMTSRTSARIIEAEGDACISPLWAS